MVKGKGFTLVELLVVIGVIALLTGILMPGLAKVRGSASRTYCKSNLNQIGIAFRAYLDDNRDVMPLACAFPWDITNKNDPEYTPPVTNFLKPLLKDSKIFMCKADINNKYYLRVGNTSYYYNGKRQTLFGWTDGLGGTAIRASRPAKEGVKEKNIDVMSDFDAFHGKAGEQGGKNYLYADWHVGGLQNQD